MQRRSAGGGLAYPYECVGDASGKTKFLVSDQVHEAMFGMDWLLQQRCRIRFGSGALLVGRLRYPFIKKDDALWSRRISVVEGITLPPRSQC